MVLNVYLWVFMLYNTFGTNILLKVPKEVFYERKDF